MIRQTIRLIGGPYDGTTFDADTKFELPSEILFRQSRWQPYLDAVYTADNGMEFVEAVLNGQSPERSYHYAGQSEMIGVVHSQARMILCREDEIRRLQKRFAGLQERYNRSHGAKKAAKTRARNKKQAKD